MSHKTRWISVLLLSVLAGMALSACTTPDAGYNCPAILCPLPPCSQVTTQAACDPRADCHSVFVDPGTPLCGKASLPSARMCWARDCSGLT